MKLTILLINYNEENTIDRVMQSLKKFTNQLDFGYEVVFLDDCSSDDSINIALKYKKEFKNFSLIFNQNNLGITRNIKKGIRLAKGEYVVYVPTDLQFKPEYLIDFIPYIGKCDIVNGYRVGRGSYKFLHKIMASFYVFLLNMIFQKSIPDYNWVHMWKKSSYKKLDIFSNSIFFLANILLEAKRKKLKIKNVKLKMEKREYGKSSTFRIKPILDVIKDILRYLI